MKKIHSLNLVILIIVNVIFSFKTFGQFSTAVYSKPIPDIITVDNQPNDFKFTSHIVNIKIPTNVANDWSIELEKQYIQNLFNLIDDKDFVIANYSGFYFPPSSSLTGAHHINIQNNVQNIGLNLSSQASQYNSTNLLGIIRLTDDWGMRPNIVTHELFHQWNSHLKSAFYWLVDPSFHTGLVEQSTSCFENYRNTFEHVRNNIYSYKQHFSGGFVGELEGYLAGLWDAPSNLKTLKNYYHDSSLEFVNMGDYYYVEVFADEIYNVSKSELFTTYGGERVPSYQNSMKDYNCVVVVFSLENFLNDDYLKGFHYASIVNEIEEPNSEYNTKYDEVFGIYRVHSSRKNPDYGTRQLNPYHASYKKLKFSTKIFDDNLLCNEVCIDDKVFIYPNPTENKIRIEVPRSSLKEVKIISEEGKEIKRINGEIIDMSNLKRGVYFVRIETSDGIFTKRIIKK